MTGEARAPSTRIEALQHEHNRLRQAARSGQAGYRSKSSDIDTFRDFADRVVAAGADLADPGERRSAQSILDYCSAQLLALAPYDPNMTLRLIAPFAGAAGGTGESPGSGQANAQGPGSKSEGTAEASAKSGQRGASGADDGLPTSTEDGTEVLAGRRGQAREQVRIKALARQWRLSEDGDGYLLTGPALAQAAPFWGKDPEITEFISESRLKAKNKRRLIAISVVMALLVLAIVGTGWLWAPWLSRQVLTILTRPEAATIVGTDGCNENRAWTYSTVDLNKLSALEKLSHLSFSGRLRGSTICDLILTDQQLAFPLDFSGAEVKWPYLQRVKGRQPSAPAKVDFADATVEDGRFVGAVLTEANFRNCALLSSKVSSGPAEPPRQTSFEGARLERADFSGCRIQGVSFASANLRDADFTNASISEDTDFTDANLVGASFANATIDKGAKFEDADLTDTDFRGSSLSLETDSAKTTWWQAIWSTPVDPSRYNRSDASKGNRYIRKTIELDLKAQQARVLVNSYPPLLEQNARYLALVSALNDWAWHRAVYGLELQEAAAQAEEAQSIAKQISENTEKLVSDTRGYIYLQLGRLEDARAAYAFIEPKRRAGSLATVLPGSRYRYALVLAGLGMCAEAEEVVTSLWSKDEKPAYTATHERVLVPAPAPDRCPAASRYFNR